MVDAENVASTSASREARARECEGVCSVAHPCHTATLGAGTFLRPLPVYIRMLHCNAESVAPGRSDRGVRAAAAVALLLLVHPASSHHEGEPCCLRVVPACAP
jgi:hypothetical protein